MLTLISQYCDRYRIFLTILCVITLHATVLLVSQGFTKKHVPDLSQREILTVTMSLRKTATDFASATTPITIVKTESLPENKSVPASVLHSPSLASPKKSKKITAQANPVQSNATIGDEPTNISMRLANPIHLIHPSFKGVRPSPRYPHQALTLRQEGVVIIRILISKQGDVIEASIHQSSGSVWLDMAAKQAALHTQFYPYLREGVPHISQADLPFNFMLKK